MKILIIEDEKDLVDALAMGIRKQGYLVDIAMDGEEALDLYYANSYDLIVLDLNLPCLDGIEILEIIRKENKEIKIIIVSARTEIDHRIEGLDKGANDYLIKPFSFQELLARIRSLLRRNFIQNDTSIETDYFRCDLICRCIEDLNGNKVKLTSKEYQILEYLLIHKDRPVSTEELLEKIWENDMNELSDTVKVHMSTLRKKLRNHFGKDFIEYIQKVGYTFKG
ncbi:MAG: response regulator transcription factor [Anaerorhabdus sp.]|uniref:response regulator transcription factor n=1 Tax=Anaerorhabdus sp. TaxID=1872524 RepID=UPI002FC62E81